ncbi:MAG: hypothetical protein IJ773_07905 [Lachnospiraceae bacterium]|nr:hypothetical protein [Lachnospiraceae bacterium]
MMPAITFSIARFCFLRLVLAADLDLVLLCCVALAEDFAAVAVDFAAVAVDFAAVAVVLLTALPEDLTVAEAERVLVEAATFTPALVLLLSVFPLFLLIPDVEPVPFKVPGVLF